MGEHSTLPFNELHKGIFQTGLDDDRPSTPEGIGDAYWATDTEVLWLTNADGTDWIAYQATFTSAVLNDLSDVVISGAAKGDILVKTGTNWINWPVETDGLYLKVDSDQIGGVVWGENIEAEEAKRLAVLAM